MNTRQLTAYRWPCARAHETHDPRFRQMHQHKGFLVSSILSLNK